MAAFSSTNLDVFPLCLSCDVFGWTVDAEQAFALLDAYAEAGGDFVDTADSYSAWVDGDAVASRRKSSAAGWRIEGTATSLS